MVGRMKKNKIIEWILTAIFLILSAFGIALLIWSLIGDSPTGIQILSTFVGIITSYLLIATFKVGIFMGEMREFKETTKNSFIRIRDDIDGINKKLDLIAEKVK